MPTGPVYRFEINGKPRSQKNSKQIIPAKRGRRPLLVDDPKVARWRKQAVKQLAAQWWGREPLTCPLAAILVCYLGAKQSADTDNLAAGPLDALQHAEVIKNDRQIAPVVVIRRRDVDHPRVEIYLCDESRLHVEIVGAGRGNECTRTA